MSRAVEADEPEEAPEAIGEPPDGEPSDEPASTATISDDPKPRGSGRSRKSAGPALTGGPRVSDASGLVLGILVWGWVIVPYLKGGTDGVKAVLSAKFFNKSGGEYIG